MHFKDKRNSLTIIRASTIIIILTSLSFLLTFSQLHLVYVHGQEQTTGRQQAQQHIFINNVTDTKNDTVPNEYIVVLKDNTTDTPASIAKAASDKRYYWYFISMNTLSKDLQ